MIIIIWFLMVVKVGVVVAVVNVEKLAPQATDIFYNIYNIYNIFNFNKSPPRPDNSTHQR